MTNDIQYLIPKFLKLCLIFDIYSIEPTIVYTQVINYCCDKFSDVKFVFKEVKRNIKGEHLIIDALIIPNEFSLSYRTSGGGLTVGDPSNKLECFYIYQNQYFIAYYKSYSRYKKDYSKEFIKIFLCSYVKEKNLLSFTKEILSEEKTLKLINLAININKMKTL